MGLLHDTIFRAGLQRAPAAEAVNFPQTPRLPPAKVLYDSPIHLTQLLAPFPFRRPVIPRGVVRLRLVPFPLARMKNSLRILCHFHLRIV